MPYTCTYCDMGPWILSLRSHPNKHPTEDDFYREGERRIDSLAPESPQDSSVAILHLLSPYFDSSLNDNFNGDYFFTTNVDSLT